MNASVDGKAFLQLCLAKRLLDKEQAQAAWAEARSSGDPPQRILMRQGLMAEPTVQALEKELKRAQEPRTIAGFRLIKPLGQGGMATVFLAEQVSLGREVALKLMAPHFAADPAASERFLREARVAATVNHPNVVSIIDVGQSERQLYMALELVTGGDAAQLAERFGGTVPEPRALELLIDCSKGLQALYEARLVHRDLKPSNIFITGDGTAKLGDLGLARSENGADRLTMAGNLVGTPAFMSPEQARGGDIDIRSDIYSLGATLFALVTGRAPFSGGSPILVAAKALTDPPPDPRALVPALSQATAALILRALAKSPQDRFQTPLELRTALQEAQAGEWAPPPAAPGRERTAVTTGRYLPTAARHPATPSTQVVTRRTTRSYRKRGINPTWIGAGVAVVVVAVLVLLLSGPRNAPGPAKGAATAASSAGTPGAAATTAPPDATAQPAAQPRPVAFPDSDPLSKVPEARDYTLVYETDLARLNTVITYTVDRSATIKGFDRIGYCLELQNDARGLQYVWTAMDAFTSDAARIGIPALAVPGSFQQLVTHLTVASNVKDVPTGAIGAGVIEFWPNNFATDNATEVPGASDKLFDFGDHMGEPRDGYGSMQVHNLVARQTVFAINHWVMRGEADIGIGNCDGKNPDWTFAANASTYSSKRLRVFVHLTK